MATCLERVEGMVQIGITASTVPTLTQITNFLNEGIKDLTNKVVNLRPDEAPKFAGESEDANNSGITIVGKILSVVREHDSTSILRPCTPIPADLRFEASQEDSFHYRSKYNPGWYILNKKLHTVPIAATSNNDVKVSQVVYGSTAHGTNMGAWTNFPVDYEDLVIFYTAAKASQAAASNIQNNLPEKPQAPEVVGFDDISEVDLNTPKFTPPWEEWNRTKGLYFSSMFRSIEDGDFETSKSYGDLLTKKLEVFEKSNNLYNGDYQADLEGYKLELDTLNKTADREQGTIISEYRSKIYKYQYDITQYHENLQEIFGRYKWYMEQ